MTMFIGSQSFTSLPSFMSVGAAVSEIRESNRNKEENNNKQMAISNLTPFPGIFFSPELPFDHIYTLNLLGL